MDSILNEYSTNFEFPLRGYTKQSISLQQCIETIHSITVWLLSKSPLSEGESPLIISLLEPEFSRLLCLQNQIETTMDLIRKIQVYRDQWVGEEAVRKGVVGFHCQNLEKLQLKKLMLRFFYFLCFGDKVLASLENDWLMKKNIIADVLRMLMDLKEENVVKLSYCAHLVAYTPMIKDTQVFIDSV